MLQKSINVNLIKLSIAWIGFFISFAASIFVYDYLAVENFREALVNNRLVVTDAETGHIVNGRLYNKKGFANHNQDMIEAHI
jgi:hypothetical protein